MTIKKSIPSMLLVVGLAWTCLVAIPNFALSEPPVTEPIKDDGGHVIGTTTTILHGTSGAQSKDMTYTAGPSSGLHIVQNFDDKGKLITSTQSSPDGTRSDYHADGSGATVTTTRPDGTVETSKLDPAGSITSKTKQTTYPNGTVTTQTFDPKTGTSTGLTIKDSKGNVTTALPDGKGGFTSAVTGEHGKVATTSYDADGKLTGETTRDKKGQIISTTATTPDGKGGYSSVQKDSKGQVISTTTTTSDVNGGHTSVTKDKNGKVVSSKVYDSSGNVVSQTGKKQIMSLGTGGQPTGGTQTSQANGKHKLQTEVVHQKKEKSHDQDLGSPSGSSGATGQMQHHRRH